MGFFNKNKKSDKIPELPKLPNSYMQESGNMYNQNEQYNDYEENPLPSFPNSQMGNTMTQSTIKDAVNQNEFEESSIPHPPQLNPLQTPPHMRHQQVAPIIKSNKIHNVQKMPRQQMDNQMEQIRVDKRKPSTYEMSGEEPMIESNFASNPIREKRTEPLFIQLDKFEKTISSFDEIKLKVSEIESLLRSIKEVKAKEDEKLRYWENQIETIKSHLEEINRDLFDRM